MRAGAAVLLVAIVAGLAGGRLASGADLSEAQIQEGLAKLSAMMAADMPATARWVLVESHGRRWAGIFSQGEDVFPTEGNAFLLDEKPRKEARILVVSTGAVFKVRAEDSPEANSAADMQAMPRVFPSSWKDANVTKDVNAAAEWLKKKIKKEGVSKVSTSPGITFGMNGAPMFGNDDGGDPDAAYFQTALVWAALLHHTGRTSEAMSLAQIALSGTDEKKRKQMLDALFSRVANGGYQRAMTEFGQHHDWAKLRDELDALVKKFPQGWSNRDAVRVVLHHVTARAQLPAEAPLKARQTLPEADQKVLLAWLQEMEAGKQPSYTRWTLPPIKSEVVDEEADADAGLDLEEAVKRQGTVGVKSNTFPDSHGLAAVPLLASLLTDETLTTAGTAMQGGYSRTYFSGGGDEDPAARVRTAYNSLIKPHTRAELAWQTLQHVLPSEMRHSSDDEDSAGRADEVLQWYASVKTASPADLAMVYLESGEQDGSIIAHALTVTDPKKLEKLDALMLENADAWNPAQVEPYVRKLGPEKGGAFVAKLRTKLEADMARYGERQNSMVKQMEAGLKRLESAAKGEKKAPLELPVMLKMLAAADRSSMEEDELEMRDVFQQLPKAMKKLPLEERVKTVLPSLPDFKSQSMAASMLSYMLMREDEGDAKAKEKRKKLLEETKEHWLRLLAIEPSSDENVGQGEPMALLTRAVFCIQFLAHGKPEMEGVQLLSMLDDRGAATLREHAQALLDGKQVPPLPVAKSIDENQRKQALEEWGKKTTDAIEKELETVEIAKLITLNEALTKETELPESVTPVLWHIRQVEAPGEEWKSWKGKTVDKALITALAKQVSTSTSKSVLTIRLSRAVPALGWKLVVKESDKLGKDWVASSLENVAENVGKHLPKLAKRVSAAYFQSGRQQANWTWFDAPVTEVKEPAKEEEKKEEFEDEEIGEARTMMQEMRGEEGQSWATIGQAFDERRPDAASLVIFSAATEMLTKPEEEDEKAEEKN